MEWKCSQHRRLPAEGTCSECGVYLCINCRKLHSPPLCLKCMLDDETSRRRIAAVILVILLFAYGIGYHTEMVLPSFMTRLYSSPVFPGAQSDPLFLPEASAPSSFSHFGMGIVFALDAYVLVQGVMLLIIGLNLVGMDALKPLVYIPAGEERFSPWLLLFARLILILAIVAFTFQYGHIILLLLLLYYLYELAASSLAIHKIRQNELLGGARTTRIHRKI